MVSVGVSSQALPLASGASPGHSLIVWMPSQRCWSRPSGTGPSPPAPPRKIRIPSPTLQDFVSSQPSSCHSRRLSNLLTHNYSHITVCPGHAFPPARKSLRPAEAVAGEVVGGAVNPLLETRPRDRAPGRSPAAWRPSGPRAATGSWRPGGAGGSSGSASCWPRSRRTGQGPRPGLASSPAGGEFRIERVARGGQLSACLQPAWRVRQAIAQASPGSAQRCGPASVRACAAVADRRLNERGGETRLDRRHAAKNALVEHLGLGEVGDLRRAADDQRGRKQKILKDRPQQRGGRDALRLGVENGDQVGGGIALAAGLPQAVRLRGRGRGALERKARAGASSMRKSRLDCGVTATWAW